MAGMVENVDAATRAQLTELVERAPAMEGHIDRMDSAARGSRESTWCPQGDSGTGPLSLDDDLAWYVA
jgi:hypothetical protein